MLPDIPTVGEFVPGFEAGPFYGVGAPKDTPPEIVERLNTEINAGLTNPKLGARLTGLGCTPLPGSSVEFGKLIADETEKWAKVIKICKHKAGVIGSCRLTIALRCCPSRRSPVHTFAR